MKALIILNLEDCTFDDIEQAGIKEVTLEKKDGGCFLWDAGFKISYLPEKWDMKQQKLYFEQGYASGWNDCINRILRGNV